MGKDIIQTVNISILNNMLKEQEQKYEKRIAELEKKLNKIKEYLLAECKAYKENQSEEHICDNQCNTYPCILRKSLEIIEGE